MRDTSAATPGRHRTQRPQAVYRQVHELIVAGRIAPGTRLVETELSNALAVSRTPVREAMRRLVLEGLAHDVSTGGKTRIAVAPATLSDMIEVFEIIGALEGLAGRSLARADRHTRRRLAAELTRQNLAFAAVARMKKRPFDRFFEAHDAFHARLLERCPARLARLHEMIRPQVKRYEFLYATAVGRDFTASVREHQHVVRSIRAGDPDAVENAIRHNWDRSAERIARAVGSGTLKAIGDYRTIERPVLP